jgi:hypothetical protein
MNKNNAAQTLVKIAKVLVSGNYEEYIQFFEDFNLPVPSKTEYKMELVNMKKKYLSQFKKIVKEAKTYHRNGYFVSHRNMKRLVLDLDAIVRDFSEDEEVGNDRAFEALDTLKAWVKDWEVFYKETQRTLNSLSTLSSLIKKDYDFDSTNRHDEEFLDLLHDLSGRYAQQLNIHLTRKSNLRMAEALIKDISFAAKKMEMYNFSPGLEKTVQSSISTIKKSVVSLRYLLIQRKHIDALIVNLEKILMNVFN